jgi:hypothetical protein
MSTSRWLVIIAAALLAHLAVFLYVKPSAIRVMRRVVAPGSEKPTKAGTYPDAVFSIPVEYENSQSEPRPVPVVTLEPEHEEPPPETTTEGAASPSDRTGAPSTDLGALAGDASRTIPRGSDSGLVRIPPRPLQITWPDTRRLKHCLGHQIRIRIQVDETGRITRIEAPDEDHPPDCINAALESARQIVFAPGTIGGRPVTMWTEIRIDFRTKD